MDNDKSDIQAEGIYYNIQENETFTENINAAEAVPEAEVTEIIPGKEILEEVAGGPAPESDKSCPEPNETCFIEVMFKSQRKKLYANKNGLLAKDSEYVIVEVENGNDIGRVCASGNQALSKFKSVYKSEKPALSALRFATKEDVEKFKKNRLEEHSVIEKTKSLVEQFKLDMKITDSEWQFDRQRLTIYFTAPQRIDFRELVKELARAFKTRIELRQISTREEAKRIGGIGPCGRRLCCTCLSEDFCHVTLDHARTQQLSNNVAKLSGYCGRLKCCLLYEFDTYVEAFKKYPPLDYRIELPEGMADIVKVDIFKDLLYLHIKSAGAYKSITYGELETLVKENKIFPPVINDNNNGKNNNANGNCCKKVNIEEI